MNAVPSERRTVHGHLHAEAFCLMWYRCECGHLERMWNSRDGVTPFATVCPTCGMPKLTHAYFGSDFYAPDHKPHHGQRVWVNMTKERATQYVRTRMNQLRDRLRIDPEEEPAIRESLFDSIYHDGQAPDMVVTGYKEVQS